jgi:transposase-like protein
MWLIMMPAQFKKRLAALEQYMFNTTECPHYRSGLINQHGKAATMQRYRCKNCLKSFNALINSSLARILH